MRRFKIRNRTRDASLGDSVFAADTSAARRTGLLKHEALPEGEGLWIVPCEAVHTFFMKFPIDILYLDRSKKVLKVRRSVGPWRLSGCLMAHSVLELPAGTAARTATAPGDELEFIQS